MSIKRVWKFPLSESTVQVVSMPEGAEVLCAKAQDRTSVCLLALVESDKKHVDRVVHTYVTGYPLDDENLIYIDTVLLYEGSFVVHVFLEVVS